MATQPRSHNLQRLDSRKLDELDEMTSTDTDKDGRYVAAVVMSLGKGSMQDTRDLSAMLRGLTKKQPWNKKSLVAAGGIAVLVRVLHDSLDGETLEHIVTTLLNVANEKLCADEVSAANGFEAIARVLQIGNDAAKSNAAAAIFVLADTPNHKMALCQAGTIPPLLSLLQNGADLRGRKDAALALYQLSVHQPCAKDIAQEGGVPALIGSLVKEGEGLEEKVAAVFHNLTKVTEGRLAVEEEGGIPVLAALIKQGTPKVQESAVVALSNLAQTSSGAFDLIRREDLLPLLSSIPEESKVKSKAKTLTELLRAAGAPRPAPRSGTLAESAAMPDSRGVPRGRSAAMMERGPRSGGLSETTTLPEGRSFKGATRSGTLPERTMFASGPRSGSLQERVMFEAGSAGGASASSPKEPAVGKRPPLSRDLLKRTSSGRGLW
eukprot:TRINITY_DN4363_c0_g3_i1.p1 TRINITY_DN4363_c0_g3~~TRINITY_DN4363_c0_g3_i1.p1  ORF type:complete len:436 (+),score=76.60 TRINITY_DN4363_c0_g3_i1:64-1371(+)